MRPGAARVKPTVTIFAHVGIPSLPLMTPNLEEIVSDKSTHSCQILVKTRLRDKNR